jgi:hypothetical protein
LHWKWAEGEDPETDEKIIDIITSHLQNYYPNMPEPIA